MGALVVSTTACRGAAGGAGAGTSSPRTVRVVAAFYPLAFVAARVGGSDVSVTDLTPKGVEPHDLELDIEQIDAVDRADLAIVLGGGFQPSAEKAADQRDGPTVRILGSKVRGATLDPHVWLDPAAMRSIATLVRDALAQARPDLAAAFKRNAARLDAQLVALDAAFADGLKSCRQRTIVTSHAAFGRLAVRYHLRQRAIAGLSPEAEPDPRQLAKLVDLVKTEHVTTIFTEDLVSPKLATTLARESGVVTKRLSPLESLPVEAGPSTDYLSVMRSNLESLRSALGCT